MKDGILAFSTDLRPSLAGALKGLDDAGLLKQVVTAVAIDPRSLPGRCVKFICDILPAKSRRGIERRFLPDFLRGKTQIMPAREIPRLLASRFGGKVFAHRLWLWAELGFDSGVADRYAGVFKYVYGMEHSSLATFRKQKELGGLCILRQVIAHGRKAAVVLRREISKFPEFSDSYTQLCLKDIGRVLLRKEEEYRLANLIVANSDFVKDSFIEAGVNKVKIVVVPTGCPSLALTAANAGRGNKPLVFLFTGNLSLRKGLPYLMDAWDMLKPEGKAELWLAGSASISLKLLDNRAAGVRYLGYLPQPELMKIYQKADVFVLPTLLEGQSYAMLEALSCGLPIVTTRESGCGSLVENGNNGFLIEPANTQVLYDALAWCLEHRGQLYNMGRVSQNKASDWGVQDSNMSHAAIIKNFLENKPTEN